MSAVVAFLIIFLIFGFISQRISFLRRSLVRNLLLGYIGVLLVSSIIYYVTMKEESVQADTEQYEQEAEELYTSLFNGDVENIDMKYVKKTWKFPYERGEININQHIERSNIFIERTDELENEIEVTFYQSPLFYMGVDIHEKVMLPEVELLVDSLVVNEPEQVRIEAVTFQTSFIEGQFTGRGSWMDHYPIFRTEVLYVRIPKELKVLGDGGNIYFVPEKRS